MSDPKRIVEKGYDQISHAYRSDEFKLEGTGYEQHLLRLAQLISPGSAVLDLGCGCGVPVAQHLALSHAVTGVDISAVQIARARELVPAAQFIKADMTSLEFPAATFDAIVSFYAIIHVPLEEQPALLGKLHEWLKPGGVLMATLGDTAWTGTEDNWKGGQMYWSHTDRASYAMWLETAGFTVLDVGFVPDGRGGHALFTARA